MTCNYKRYDQCVYYPGSRCNEIQWCEMRCDGVQQDDYQVDHSPEHSIHGSSDSGILAHIE